MHRSRVRKPQKGQKTKHLPIVISIPHGGHLGGELGIPERKGTCEGRVQTKREIGVRELGEAISRELESMTGGSPIIVFCEISRKYVDVNRPCVFESLLRGSISFGAALDSTLTGAGEQRSIVPSPHTPYPGRHSYLSGGFTCKRISNAAPGQVIPIQIEVPLDLRTGRGVDIMAGALASSCLLFLSQLMDLDL